MSRTLITGGCIVTMDPQLRELPRGDLLIEDGRIAAIGPRLERPDGAEVIDAAGMIVMPGLVNGHLHTWQSALRGIAGDWTVARYMQAMHRGLATLYRPEDIYIANLMGALNQINCGATTLVDWCHNNPTPEHTDAAIEGLAQSGIRAVFLHGSPKPNVPCDLSRETRIERGERPDECRRGQSRRGEDTREWIDGTAPPRHVEPVADDAMPRGGKSGEQRCHGGSGDTRRDGPRREGRRATRREIGDVTELECIHGIGTQAIEHHQHDAVDRGRSIHGDSGVMGGHCRVALHVTVVPVQPSRAHAQ